MSNEDKPDEAEVSDETLEANNSDAVQDDAENSDINAVDDEIPTHIANPDMTLDELQNFVDEISGLLVDEELLHINLQELENVTTSIVQAVICLNRYAANSGKTIKWLNPSSGFSDAFNNLGFYSEMMKLEFA